MKKEIGSFVVGDSTKCTGCKACELACFTVHNRKSNHLGKTVGTVTVPVTPRLFLTKFEQGCMPIQCKHCEDAPCLNACTKGAISRIAPAGLLLSSGGGAVVFFVDDLSHGTPPVSHSLDSPLGDGAFDRN